MFNSNTSPSLSDIAAVTNDGFGGNTSWWFIIVLALLFFNNGNGGLFGGGASGVTDGYVLTSDFANIERKIDGVNNGLCSGFYEQAQLANGTNQIVSNGFANAELSRANNQMALISQMNANNITAMQNANALQSQLAQCCCDNRFAIAELGTTISNGFCQTNYNNATNTRDIVENQNVGTRAILDKLCSMESNAKDEKIADQQAQINALQLAASQQAQNTYLISQLKPQFPFYYGTTIS